ncbi:MAG: polysaccharide deacetylase family protein, partial [Solirubrobacterales bacterium]
MQRGSRLRRQVALTFDDGPGEGTAAVLDALDALRLPATFFVIGQQVPERADLLARMVAEGHEVGVHAWEHPDLRAEPERAEVELDRTIDAVRAAAGSAPRLFRPPLGAWTPEVVEVARRRSLTTVLWDVNPHDYA